MGKLLHLPLLLIAACLIAGLYGALHNQISYTVSPDYFHAFKFIQFKIPDTQHDRIGAAIVGWRASWWMGLIIGTPILLVGLISRGWKMYLKNCMAALGVCAGTALVVGFGALLYASLTIKDVPESRRFPNNVVDKIAFQRAGTMHNFSYLGGLIGILTGCIFLAKQARKSAIRSTGGNFDSASTIRILRTFVDSTGRHRVHIIRNNSGTFSYEEEEWSDDPYEMCFVPCNRHHVSICDSEKTATREALGNAPGQWDSVLPE